MFRACSAPASRCLAQPASTSSLHTSAVAHAKPLRKSPPISKVQAKILRKEAKDASREYAVLGYRPGQQHKWHRCDLAKVVVTEESLREATPETYANSEGDVHVPAYLGFGISDKEKEMFFKLLPPLTVQGAIEKDIRMKPPPLNMENVVKDMTEKMKEEVQKANMFAKVADLRNASARGLALVNRRRCVEEFSGPGKPDDTGRPEVQAAILTTQIRNLWSHLLRNHKDLENRRSLRKLVHQRAKILKYLRSKDLDRYEAVLPRLALDAASVEGELLV
ncbi:S15/NS1 RNA-binding domain-containing protein [Coniophora puteana RWD-64-598 SS2]|uniref:S15/NS1 RNA-binding domain-containing protein n=1 Tax=Coniophora puteana (strain RWD-64-598) TaxID=741705 RepID=A0A5M3N7G5_CONPW|nr:S15/NS1 RNA-binding domain-containing protein [Coniophora puteana RWD-64-598 SS2]EIW87228.1 S15/NS1 RNA-binding domain-containing protein [Coniophora puteana RWD-64-598 SS2]